MLGVSVVGQAPVNGNSYTGREFGISVGFCKVMGGCWTFHGLDLEKKSLEPSHGTYDSYSRRVLRNFSRVSPLSI